MPRTAYALALCLLVAKSAHAAADDRLFPDHAESLARTATLTEQRLVDVLRGLPDVIAARVHLTLVDESRMPLDLPRPKPRLSAWLSLSGKGPSDAELKALLLSAAPRLDPSDIHISRHHVQNSDPRGAEPFATVGPFRVARDSAPLLRASLAAFLTVIALLSAVVLSRRTRA